MTAKEALNKINAAIGTLSPVAADLCCIINRGLEKVPPAEIDQPIYCIYNIYDPNTYYIAYGYVSSIRQDKDKKWSFRYSYWFPSRSDDPLCPKIRDKSEKGKSLHEVEMKDLYTGGEYKNQEYFISLEDAQKYLKEVWLCRLI